MTRMWAVLGDMTSSGGQVVTASQFTDIDGKGVARVNDKATCPTHKGTFAIVDGDPTTIIDGQPVALHGSKLSCGCTVLAVQQIRVALQPGNGAGATTGATIAMAASAAGSVAADSANDAGITHVHSDDPHESPPDPVKAREVVAVANAALMEAEAFRPYATELEAANAWAAIVEPIANSAEFNVEVGSNISRVGNHYLLGTTFSTGSYGSCDGLPDKGHKVEGGTHTAYIHTHPYVGGGVSRNRAFVYDDFPEDDFSGGVARFESGWDTEIGDFQVAYAKALNLYIAEPGVLIEWRLDRYREAQRLARDSVSLDADPLVELGAGEVRH